MTGAGTAAIDPADVERRRLDRLDSPQRIAWLRKQIGDYIVDLAARTFFRLPTWCAGHAVPDPKAEAEATCRGTAGSHGLTPIEAEMAFKAEWTSAIALAQQAGEKLKIVALSHIKAAGGVDGLEAALHGARNKFPAHWPFLTDDDLAAIAAGFRRTSRSRRAA